MSHISSQTTKRFQVRWALSLFLLSAAGLAVTGHAATEFPNIVLIVSDDHGWTDYGFMGHPHVQTPTLDAFSRQALVFRRGYVPSSLCRASLASILTGLYPHQHRITSNDPPLPAPRAAKTNPNTDPTFLAQRQQMIANIDRVETLPRMLSRLGYASFQTGKWWEGDFRRGGFTEGMSLGGRHGDKGLEIGRSTMAPAFDFMARAVEQQRPFLLWYAPMLPHSPHNPPERLLAKYRPLAPTVEIAKYWACIEWFDEGCGALLTQLETLGVRNNTLVMYVADNGWLQDPEKDRYAPRSKQSPYDGGLRTPIMLQFPGRIEPADLPELASSIDLVPTILAFLKQPQPTGLPGINLLDRRATAERRAIYGACFTHNAVDIERPASSLRFRWCISEQLKLIVPQPSNEPDAPRELFDLSNDPHELRNLAAERPQDAQRLAALLDQWWAP